MSKEYIHLQSIVNYRIPIDSDGNLGTPQITAKWTKEIGAPKKAKPKPKKTIDLVTDSVKEVIM